jgi:hypothetical protein
MLTSQGFLLTGFAVATTRSDQSSPTTPILMVVIGLVGIAIALLSLLGIRAAYISLKNLRNNWKAYCPEDQWRFYPDITTPKASRLGQILGYGLPLVLLAVWVVLLLAYFAAPNLIPTDLPWPF